MTKTTNFVVPSRTAEMFAGCTYLVMANKVRLPNGRELDRKRFNVVFGGYVWALEESNLRTPTTDAWKAFTQSEHWRPPME